jgi:gamma-glutamyltranspeptidase/glutathione hydrolase
MDGRYDRREVLKMASGVVLGSAVPAACGGEGDVHKGCVVGQPQAAKVGGEVLAAGGNAVDAAVAAALVAGVVAVQQCGIGGYGGHMVIALAGGKKVTAIDFNTAAPKAARADLFALDAKGNVKGQANMYGWLAAGVPGTLAGLQLALDRYGTQPFAKLVQPAIRFAREGFEVPKELATAIRVARPQLAKDPASARLLLEKGEPLKPGTTFRNPDLATLLETLAERKSVASFYGGDIGRRIAAAFQKNGGLVTAKDLADYQAREVEPLEFSWRGYSVRTAPLTAGGLTVLEALAILKALEWDNWPAKEAKTHQARLEAMRIAWDDRLEYLGDTDHTVQVLLHALFTPIHADPAADHVRAALKEGKPVPTRTDGRKADGTVHLSAADAQGNLVALTLTHGGYFGARVTVDGLGLILGHGMSRFDPRPEHANAPGPGKRPLHNMCPTIVRRDGRPVVALGGTGGRKIPNAVCDVLAHFVGRGLSLEEAVAAPRMHTEGGLNVTLEARWPEADVANLKKVGYAVTKGASATVHAVARDPKTGHCRPASR